MQQYGWSLWWLMVWPSANVCAGLARPVLALCALLALSGMHIAARPSRSRTLPRRPAGVSAALSSACARALVQRTT